MASTMDDNHPLEPLKCFKDLNNIWLENLVSKHYKRTVASLSWSSQSPTAREGFLSELIFIDVKVTLVDNAEEHLNLVFKFLPQEKDKYDFVTGSFLDLREVQFNLFFDTVDILKDSGLHLPVPKVYYAGRSPTAMTLVLGNMVPLKYKMISTPEGSNLSQTKVALRCIAVLHAVGLAYKAKHGLDALKQKLMTIPFSFDFVDTFLSPNLETLIGLYEDGDPHIDLLKALKRHVKPMMRGIFKEPFMETLVHGDYWAGQILYSEDESKACVLDWQFGHVGNPVADITSFLLMSSQENVYENHVDEVLVAYWETLTSTLDAAGVVISTTYEQLKTNVNSNWMHGFVAVAASMHDFLPGNKITIKRTKGYIRFLRERGYFDSFLDEVAK